MDVPWFTSVDGVYDIVPAMIFHYVLSYHTFVRCFSFLAHEHLLLLCFTHSLTLVRFFGLDRREGLLAIWQVGRRQVNRNTRSTVNN